MKRIYITCTVNVVLIFMLAAFFSTDGSGTVSDYIFDACFLSLLWSALCALIGFVFLALRQKRWGQGFLVAAGILMALAFLEYSFSGFVI